MVVPARDETVTAFWDEPLETVRVTDVFTACCPLTLNDVFGAMVGLVASL